MFDLAFDKPTCDWLLNANIDLKSIRGDDVVKQRIYTRLRIPRGWINDPTNGTLGSRLKQAARGQRDRAITEIPLYVEEALDPMPDVTILDVEVTEITNDSVFVMVTYRSHDPGDPRPVTQQASDTISIELPV